MTTATGDSALRGLTDRYTALVEDLQVLEMEGLSSDEVLELLRQLEAAQRRLVPVQHAAIAQLEQRSVAFERGARNTATLLGLSLHLSPGDAGARVKAARLLGPRRTVIGVPVEPQHPVVAAAQVAGTIGAQHARVITDLLAKLPDEILDTERRPAGADESRAEGTGDAAGELPATIGDWLEQHLTELASQTDPRSLENHARDLQHALDQDGMLREHDRRERGRGLDLAVRSDGSSTLTADLTAEATEHLLTALDPLAKPAPAADGVPDSRTPRQRRHDGFLAWLLLVERAKFLPDCGGFSATIVLMMDADTYAAAHPAAQHSTSSGGTGEAHSAPPRAGSGMARTGHGFRIPAEKALTWTGPAARVIGVLLSKTRGIEAYSSIHRIATEQQRLALLARDKGCIVPGCDVPPAWTEAHHVTDWKDTGRTCVDDLALLCTANHRDLPRACYEIRMINGRPWLIPPPWIDPEQKPIRNTIHD